MIRQIVLDTETTGLDAAQGHRIIEIGGIEMIERKITNNHFHYYLNPERDIDAGAAEIHGITTEFLQDKSKFSDIATELVEYVQGAELIIHNAAFDIEFINAELAQAHGTFAPIESYCSVIDTLAMARERHPGQRNSLDALCARYSVDNSRRDLHGALLDAQILADVYLSMTGGQTALVLESDNSREGIADRKNVWEPGKRPQLRVLQATNDELTAHEARLDAIDNLSELGSVWRRL